MGLLLHAKLNPDRRRRCQYDMLPVLQRLGVALSCVVLAWWRSGYSVGLATQKVAAVPLSGNNLGQAVHTCASVTKQYNLVPVKRR